MEEEYFVDETVNDRYKRNEYVPVSVKIYKKGEKGFVENSFPWHRVFIDRVVKKGTPIFVVSYIQHSGKDQDARAFLTENAARKYIDGLRRAIQLTQKVENVELHFDMGEKDLKQVLEKLPLNTYVNFRTPTDEFSVTFSRAVY
jgi:hypothetical protein